MLDLSKVGRILPARVRDALDAHVEAASVFAEIRDPRVLRSLAPSGARGLLLHRGKQGVPTLIRATHSAHFDWPFPSDQPEMRVLYERGKTGQWNGASLPWSIDVDPLNPEVPLVPDRFVDFGQLEALGVTLGPVERRAFTASLTTWM